jgi:hypothetical protein
VSLEPGAGSRERGEKEDNGLRWFAKRTWMVAVGFQPTVWVWPSAQRHGTALEGIAAYGTRDISLASAKSRECLLETELTDIVGITKGQ